MNTEPANLSTTPKTNEIKMEVCDYRNKINNSNNLNNNIMTAPMQSHPGADMNILRRNTVSSASSLESSSSYGNFLRQSPPFKQLPAMQAPPPMQAPLPPTHTSHSVAPLPSTHISQSMTHLPPTHTSQSMAPAPNASAVVLSHNSEQNQISRPLSASISTPLSLIDSLKLKFPLAGQINRTGTGSQLSHITGITPNRPEGNDSPIVGNTNVPEFLYQLIKMLTDNHRDVIEWSNGKIEVHNPHKLESDVLNKYFRHSKYASFQRQLNYFGFRKLAGKGKMAPCSYVNENATSDLRSLLKMKRKTSATTRDAKSEKADESTSMEAKPNQAQCSPFMTNNASFSTTHGIDNHMRKRSRSCVAESNCVSQNVPKFAIGKGIRHSFNGYLKSSPAVVQPSNSLTSTLNNPLLTNPTSTITTASIPDQKCVSTLTNSSMLDPQSIAKSVVGKGVRHQFATQPFQQTRVIETPVNTSPSLPHVDTTGTTYTPSLQDTGISKQEQNESQFLFLDPQQLGMGVEDSLSELQNNFRNSLNDSRQTGQNDKNNASGSNKMERVSSLVNLAMIPDLDFIQPTPVNEMKAIAVGESDNAMLFIDFPTNDIELSNLSTPPVGNLNTDLTSNVNSSFSTDTARHL